MRKQSFHSWMSLLAGRLILFGLFLASSVSLKAWDPTNPKVNPPGYVGFLGGVAPTFYFDTGAKQAWVLGWAGGAAPAPADASWSLIQNQPNNWNTYTPSDGNDHKLTLTYYGIYYNNTGGWTSIGGPSTTITILLPKDYTLHYLRDGVTIYQANNGTQRMVPYALITSDVPNPVIPPYDLSLTGKSLVPTASIFPSSTSITSGQSVTLTLGSTGAAPAGSGTALAGPNSYSLADPSSSVVVTPPNASNTYTYTVVGKEELDWTSSASTGTFWLTPPGQIPQGTKQSYDIDVTGNSSWVVTQAGLWTITQSNSAGIQTSTYNVGSLPSASASTTITTTTISISSFSSVLATPTPGVTITPSPSAGTNPLTTTIGWTTSNVSSFAVTKNGSAWASSGSNKVDASLPVGSYTYQITGQPQAYSATLSWSVVGAASYRVTGPGFDSGWISATSVSVPMQGAYTLTAATGSNGAGSTATANLTTPAGPGAAVASALVTVGKGAQTVSISPAWISVAPTDTATFTASGGQTSYTWGGQASGSGSSKAVTAPSSEGDYSVTVQDLGDSNWSASNVATATLHVQKLNQAALTLNATSPQTYNTTQTLSVSGGTTGGSVTYSIVGQSAGGVGSLSGAVLTANTGTGWVDLQATMAGSTRYNAVTSNTVRVTFQKANQMITLNATSPQTYGTTQTLSSSGFSGVGAKTYSIVGQSAAGAGSIAGAVLTAGTGTGWVDVQVTIATDSNYNAATSATVRVTFQKADQSITLNAGSPLTYGTSETISSSGSFGTGAKTFSVMGTSSVGVVSLVSTTLTANSGTGWVDLNVAIAADNNYNAATSPIVRVTLQKANQSTAITFNPSTPQTYNTTQTLTASGGDGTGGFSFAIMGQSAAGAGSLAGAILTANTGTGWVDLTATKAGDNNYNAQTSSTQRVNFQKADQTITLTPMTIILAPGDVQAFTAAGGRTSYTWGGQASGASGAVVNVTAPATEGTYTVTVQDLGDANWNASNVATATISDVATKMLSLSPVNSTITITDPKSPNYGRSWNRSWFSKGRWWAYLGRNGVKFTMTGQGQHAVQAFELQALDTSTNAQWTTIASGAATSGTNGSGLTMTADFSLMLGTTYPGQPLVPASYAAGTPLTGYWYFRARVQDTDGRWSSYTANVMVTVLLPLATHTVTGQTLPPVGATGAWFAPSDTATFPIPVWIP